MTTGWSNVELYNINMSSVIASRVSINYLYGIDSVIMTPVDFYIEFQSTTTFEVRAWYSLSQIGGMRWGELKIRKLA